MSSHAEVRRTVSALCRSTTASRSRTNRPSENNGEGMKALGFAAGILILNLGPIPQVAAQTDDSCEAKAAHIVTQRGDTLAAKIRAAYPDSFANLDDARLTAIFHNELPCLASAESKGEAANHWRSEERRVGKECR